MRKRERERESEREKRKRKSLLPAGIRASDISLTRRVLFCWAISEAHFNFLSFINRNKRRKSLVCLKNKFKCLKNHSTFFSLSNKKLRIPFLAGIKIRPRKKNRFQPQRIFFYIFIKKSGFKLAAVVARSTNFNWRLLHNFSHFCTFLEKEVLPRGLQQERF